MVPLLDRLREALAPDITIEGPLASGGFGVVFAGRDTILDRAVAIKVIRADRATAVSIERFVREGQAVARLEHANVVPVYRADRTPDGDPYLVMPLMRGGTLSERLKQGPLGERETLALGRDLLRALVAAHAAGIIHRDIKPSNIFFDQDGRRALLGDFGVATARDLEHSALTGTGDLIGTLGYMSPEALRGAPADVRSDIYSLGLVLHEACTGRLPTFRSRLNPGDFSALPRSLRAPIDRALRLDPDERWPGARAFAESLGQSKVARRRSLVLIGAAAAGLVALLVWWPPPRPAPPPLSVRTAVYPFDVAGPNAAVTGAEVTGLLRAYLEPLPGVSVEITKKSEADWNGSSLPPLGRLVELAGRNHLSYALWGMVRPRGDSLEIEAIVVDSGGAMLPHVILRGDTADRFGLVDQVGARVLEQLTPHLGPAFHLVPKVAAERPTEAVLEFVRGEMAFARDAWLVAERHYERALALDSTFVLAAWRLGNARRWMPLRSAPPFPPGFRRMYDTYGQTLDRGDRLLVEAQFAPTGAPRLDKYAAAVRDDSTNTSALLLYGDELFHRGPLAGRPLSDAVEMLTRATLTDSTLAPAWEHLTWALIRLGQQGAAAHALTRLQQVAGRPEDSEIYLPAFLAVAYGRRFGPVSDLEESLLRDPGALALAARGGLAFDLPEAEFEFGRRLSAMREAPQRLRGSGHIAQGAALMALGRPAEALNSLDRAASLLPDRPEAELEAAEWRVVTSALGVPGMDSADASEGRRRLEVIAAATKDDRRLRAVWALGLEAAHRRDTTALSRWRSVLAANERPGAPYGLLLAAVRAAHVGDLAAAIRISNAGLALDSAGYSPDPFFRSALHLLRGEWLLRAGRAAAADSAWRWYENTDVVGWPSSTVQPAEVDWALGTYARLRRAELAAADSRWSDACPMARRVLSLWKDAAPALDEAVHRTRTLIASCPRDS